MHTFCEHFCYFKTFLTINDDGLDCFICRSTKPSGPRMGAFDIFQIDVHVDFERPRHLQPLYVWVSNMRRWCQNLKQSHELWCKLVHNHFQIEILVWKGERVRMFWIGSYVEDNKSKPAHFTNTCRLWWCIRSASTSVSSIMQYFIYFISCTMLKISVWNIVTDSYDSMTFMDLETRGVISSNRLTW